MIFGPIEFTKAPLVSGPDIILHIFGLPISSTIVTTWVIIAGFFILFKLGTKNLKINPGKFQIFLETMYEFLETMIAQILGIWKNKYFAYFSTLFLFIFVSNIISFFPIPWASMQNGMIRIYPAFRSPTADLNTTVCLAFLTTCLFVSTAIKYNGIGGYLKGFTSPTIVMLPMNIVGEMAKPLNISMRLFGNMFAGTVIMGLLYMAVPWGIPAPLHLYFDLFAGAVQSFVFVTLSMVYVQGALGDAEYNG
ncbi:MAG: F0F1 ATP synthase subunit A [Fusobacterium sp.]|uniref:F0F1 ATP synthase subunit A n=1 Tax=Fusobacterium sp. TaxID=68766 RepID=UPI0026DD13B8|nr:F0F1 ATP synthase subunit A [Fusobacterium sp.]MDO4690497.1 F0F1 ATP synthase subunit A [Fusobacterium sp.]